MGLRFYIADKEIRESELNYSMLSAILRSS
jgi:hypothetical protein